MTPPWRHLLVALLAMAVLVMESWFVGSCSARAADGATDAAASDEVDLQFVVRVDAGILPYGVPTVVTAEVSNPYRQPFRVGDIQTTCGCTVVDQADVTIEPGHQAEFQVTVTPTKPGTFGEAVRVHGTVGTQQAIAELRIRGDVHLPLQLVAPKGPWVIPSERPPDESTFSLIAHSFQEPDATGFEIRTIPEGIRWDVEESVHADGRSKMWRVRLHANQSLVADDVPGPVLVMATIDTPDGKVTAETQVWIRNHKPVRIGPRALPLGARSLIAGAEPGGGTVQFIAVFDRQQFPGGIDPRQLQLTLHIAGEEPVEIPCELPGDSRDNTARLRIDPYWIGKHFAGREAQSAILTITDSESGIGGDVFITWTPPAQPSDP